MNQNHNFSHNPQLADLQAGGQDNLDTFYNYDSLFMNAFNTSQNRFHASHGNINTNGHYSNVNLPDTTSQPQLNRSNIFIFEIPGFEIIIRPKSNQFMNLTNLNIPSMNSYSSVAGMSSTLNQNQNYVNGNSASGNYDVNNMNTINMQNGLNNNQSFITNNSQYQFQQQNSLGYNSYHG